MICEGIILIDFYFLKNNVYLVKGDNRNILNKISSKSIDVIFADPPYFLSNGGFSCSSGKMVSVNKGSWDKSLGFDEVLKFNQTWITECKRVLKDDGTMWISGTLHNIMQIGYILQSMGFHILNMVTWYKTNAPPNLSCRYFTHSHETILWVKKSSKSKHYFNYDLMKEMNGGKQMRDVWQIPCINKKEKKYGKFPTQKPIELMKRIILSSSQERDIILDPFNGSGSTGVVSKKYNRIYIGIEKEQEYLDLSINRIENSEELF